MEEINDWQPAVIAPSDLTRHDSYFKGSAQLWSENAGRVIRIKRYPLMDYWICGTKHNFVMHEEDSWALFGQPNTALCEHQILTD